MVQDPITKVLKKRSQYITHIIDSSLDNSLDFTNKLSQNDLSPTSSDPSVDNVIILSSIRDEIEKTENKLAILKCQLSKSINYNDSNSNNKGVKSSLPNLEFFDLEFGISLSNISFNNLSDKSPDIFNISLSSQEPTLDISTISHHLQKLPKLPILHKIIDDYYKFSWPQNPVIPKNYKLFEKASYIIKKLNENVEIRDGNIIDYLKFLFTIIDPFSLYLIYIIIAISSSSFNTTSSINPYYYFLTSTGFLNNFLTSKHFKNLQPWELDNLRLKKLQALLLLVIFGLLKPIKPGIWFIINQCSLITLEMDLHLESTLQHYENVFCKKNIFQDSNNSGFSSFIDLTDINSNNYHDLHRFLFWITFSLERQISYYVDKPTLISEISVTSEKITYKRQNDPDYIIPNFFIELRTFQGKFLSPSKSDLNPLTYISLNEYNFLLHSKLNKLLNSYIEMIRLTKDNTMKMKLLYVNNFFILNYYFILQQIYKPSSFKKKSTENELNLLFNCSYQIIMIYENLATNKKINYAYLSIYSIRQASLTFLYSLLNSDNLFKNENIFNIIDKFMNNLKITFDLLKDECPPSFDVHQNIINMLNNLKKIITEKRIKLNLSSSLFENIINEPQSLEDHIIEPINVDSNLTPKSPNFNTSDINYSEFFSNVFGDNFLPILNEFSNDIPTSFISSLENINNLEDNSTNIQSLLKTDNNYLQYPDKNVLEINNNDFIINETNIDAIWDKLFLNSSDLKSAML